MTRLAPLLLTLVCLAGLSAGARGETPAGPGPAAQAVVTLASPPLAGSTDRRAADRVAAEQRAFADALRAIPGARVGWRYRLVANGVSVVLPARHLARLSELPGVREVYPAARYRASLDRSPQQIGANTLWTAAVAALGDGIKIAIVDDGVDQAHPFFAPAGYAYPPGFPKGQRAYTTPKVIVARAFAPPGTAWPNASKPFDPEHSGHGTHVAGIAAGNAGTSGQGGRVLSGVAPRAYIGNYKALSVPTDADVGLDGNSPELVAAIEAAVADGMDVINLSLGEPEIEPSRDIVALALDAAAKAGVVPVVAAGNDFDEFGRGSVSSPGSSASAITVGAVTTASSGAADVVAGFSSAGPTPLSLRLKPDVSAPGVSILSAQPQRGWTTLSGTSMAAPHVAGAAALLRELHPDWSVAQLKSALLGTATPAWAGPARRVEARPGRGGAGVVDVAAADRPLVFAAPASVSFGLLETGETATASIGLADAGGGAGAWAVSVETRATAGGATVSAPAGVTVPGTLELNASAGRGADGELAGVVMLTRGADKRRIPFWAGLTVPSLPAPTPISKPGDHTGNTRGKPRRATAYRYPEVPAGGQVDGTLAGPEQVFRVTLRRPVANLGVVVTSRAKGVRVEPRIVVGQDESRLAGYAALPFNLNPYLREFGAPVLAAGVIRPAAGAYDIVFDSPTVAGAGRYAFRLWIDDTTPPKLRLLTRSVRQGQPLRVRATDAGAGIDPATVWARLDGEDTVAFLRGGDVLIETAQLTPGAHRLRLQVSDYQESRNMENVATILPNTRTLVATVVVR